jgi:hypothetical protein
LAAFLSYFVIFFFFVSFLYIFSTKHQSAGCSEDIRGIRGKERNFQQSAEALVL